MGFVIILVTVELLIKIMKLSKTHAKSVHRLVTAISEGRVLGLDWLAFPSPWLHLVGRSLKVRSCTAVSPLPGWRPLFVVWAVDGMALVVTLLCSITAARHFSTWLCHQVYLPWLRQILESTRMCFRVVRAAHRSHAGSSPSQRCRFAGEGRTWW